MTFNDSDSSKERPASFSDADLKRLKERIAFSAIADTEEIPRLLARLECSEKALESIMALKTWTGKNNRALVEAWRRAKGESDVKAAGR